MKRRSITDDTGTLLRDTQSVNPRSLLQGYNDGVEIDGLPVSGMFLMRFPYRVYSADQESPDPSL